jgi:hypothetical protein
MAFVVLMAHTSPPLGDVTVTVGNDAVARVKAALPTSLPTFGVGRSSFASTLMYALIDGGRPAGMLQLYGLTFGRFAAICVHGPVGPVTE